MFRFFRLLFALTNGKVLTTIFTFVAFFSFSQSISYQVQFQDFFGETEIYSIAQDSSKNIWISGNTGLYKYNGSEFKHYESPTTKKSIFGLFVSEKNEVWCHNLSGEIFKIENDSLKLFHTIPDSLMGNQISFCAYKDELIIGCKAIYSYKKNGINLIIPKSNKPFNISTVSKDKNSVLIHSSNSKTIYEYKNDSLLPFVDIDTRQEKCCFYYNIIQNNNKTYLHKNRTLEVFEIKKNYIKPIKLTSEHYENESNIDAVCITKNHFVFRLNKGGVLFFDKNQKALFNKKPQLENYFISGFLEDSDGNYWLTTFYNGIIKINNPQTVSFLNNSAYEKETFTKIEGDDKNLILIGSNSGKIFGLQNNKAKNIYQNENLKIELIHFDKNSNSFFTNDNLLKEIKVNRNKCFINKKFQVGSVKDIQNLGNNNYLLATNTSVQLITNPLSNNKNVANILNLFDLSNPTILTNDRAYRVAYDSIQNQVWVADINGLFIFSKNGKAKFEIKNKTPIVSDIVFEDSTIWISTSNLGVLKIKGNNTQSFLRNLDATNNLTFKKIKPYKSTIWISSKENIFYKGKNQNNFKVVSFANGLKPKSIKDFTVQNDTLFVLYSNELISIPIKTLTDYEAKPLSFQNIFINDSIYKDINNACLKWNQNKISFNLTCKNYTNNGKLYYYYRLNNLDTTWLKTAKNIILYNSLPPGEYMFEAYCIDENFKKSNVVKLNFTINKPYWATWWFYSLCGLSIVVIVSFIYLKIISSIKRKNKLIIEKQQTERELIESRLTSLRSQMNPHFMFNALNSIQELILLSKKELASEHLSKFADLMRIYLNHSQQKTVTLQEEIDALSIYLEIEKIRFNEDLLCEINYDNTINIHQTEIPSFLIQPFVENAIKHGLFHSKREKKLSIKFSKEESLLVCTITDNGIGRKHSEEIQNPNKKHKSFATDATANRIKLLNINRVKTISFEIIDLFENNQPCGTQVVLKIPLA